MGSMPLAALAVRPVEQPDILGEAGKALQIRNLAQAGQQQAALAPGQQELQRQQITAGQQEEQLHQIQINDANAGMKALKAWDGKDPLELPELVRQNGGSINAVADASAKAIKQKQDILGMNKAQTDAELLKTNFLLGKLNAASDPSVSDQDLPNNILNAAKESVQAGYLDPQHAQSIQQIVQQYGNDPTGLRSHLSVFEKSLQGYSEQLANKDKAATTQATVDTAASRVQAAQTGAERLAQEENPNSGLNKAKIAVSGQEEAAKLPSEEAIAKVREEVTQTFQNNKDAKDKIETNVLKPYQDKLASIGELNSALDQAQQGNVTAARGALLKLIGVTNPDGTKRYNEAEASRLLSQGSIPQRLQGSLQNALTGNNWTPQILSDMKAFAAAQGDVAKQTLNNGIDNTNKLYGSSVGQDLKGGAQGGGPPQSSAPSKDFGPANGKPEGATGTINGTRVAVKNGRIVAAQ